jgi:uncharacterized Zn finger protein
VIKGRTIAHSFWGKSWCENLESYSDFENRLPRGRTYVRNGSVVDLQIGPGKITALVSGSALYKVTIEIAALPARHWRATKSRCAGQIGSLVELLQGRLSESVMDIVTARTDGLFPKPSEIKMSCSCPDWAGMCKHVAAVMYGVGARLDQRPELLFCLRKVDQLELIEEVVPRAGAAGAKASGKKTLVDGEVAGVFGIELAEPEASDVAPVSVKQPEKITVRVEHSPQKPAPKRRKERKSARPLKKIGSVARTRRGTQKSVGLVDV